MNHSSLSALLAQFRTRYPMGSVVSEFVAVHDGHYIVRASVHLGSLIVATGLATAPDIESAEDRAKARAIEAVGVVGAALTTATPLPYGAPGDYSTPAPTVPLRPSSAPPAPTVPLPPPMDEPAIAPVPDRLNTRDRSPKETAIAPPTTPPIADLYAYASLDAPVEDGPPPRLDEIDVVPLTKLTKLSKSPPVRQITPVEAPPDDVPVQGGSDPVEAVGSVDLSEVLAQIDVEMMRLGWTKRQGRDYLKQHYGKATRSELDVEELFDFLHYLQSQPADQGAFG